MVTKIQKGHPEEVRVKRELRIKEAINFETGTKENPQIHIIGEVNHNKIYFLKPGKEVFRKTKVNINDMTPGVGELYEKYSFADIWKDLLNLSCQISNDSFKQLNVLLYRLAYLMDCTIEGEKVRYAPKGEILEIIENIQKEIDSKSYNFKVLEFLNFIDVLSWNEDVKYQSSCVFQKNKERVGRLNTVFSVISVPLVFKEFVDKMLKNEVDYPLLIDLAQNFSRARGVHAIPNKELIRYLSPYLSE